MTIDVVNASITLDYAFENSTYINNLLDLNLVDQLLHRKEKQYSKTLAILFFYDFSIAFNVDKC